MDDTTPTDGADGPDAPDPDALEPTGPTQELTAVDASVETDDFFVADLGPGNEPGEKSRRRGKPKPPTTFKQHRRKRYPRLRKIAKRSGIGVLVLVVGLLVFMAWSMRRPLPTIDGEVAVPGLVGEVTVIRDEQGIPHIYAENVNDLSDRQSTRLNSSHTDIFRMPSSA